MSAPLPPIATLLPHGPPSILLDTLLHLDGERAVARVRITRDSLFFESEAQSESQSESKGPGGVPAIVAIEYMAQTIAAFSGALRKTDGLEVQLGFLLGCRQLTLAVGSFALGDELEVEARHVWSSNSLGQFDCSVTRAGIAVAHGTLNVYRGSLEKVPDGPAAELGREEGRP